MSEHKVLPPWLKRLLTTPVAELGRWQYVGRFLVELGIVGARQLREHRASAMAAALAFRTIFGIIPLVIVATLIFRAFGGIGMVNEFVNSVVAAGGLEKVAGPEEGQTLAAWLRETLSHINENLSAKTLGVIGVLVFSWAAVSLLTTIERSFNIICHAAEHRSLARRLPLYWTTVTVGPALLYLSFHFEHRFETWVTATGASEGLAGTIGTVTAFVATWLFLLVLYKLLPHTRVQIGAGLAGSLVAAILWTVATQAFATYVSMSFGAQASAFRLLYGALGLIPVFMFWVYLLWLIVLYGLELTSLLQVVGKRLDGKLPDRGELPPLTDPASIVPLMKVIAQHFAGGKAATAADLSEETGLVPRVVSLMTAALQEAGFVHRVGEEDEERFALARPVDRISTADLLAVSQKLVSGPSGDRHVAWGWVRSLHEAELSLGVHKPLAEV